MMPKDRSKIETEQRNQKSVGLHQKTIAECLQIQQEADAEIPLAIKKALPSIQGLIEAIDVVFRRGGRVLYMGAGTSGRLGVLDASEIPPTYQITPDRFVGIIAGGDGALRKSSEGKEDEWQGSHCVLNELKLTEIDVVIGIAAGGTTPYVLGAFDYAKKINSKILTGFIVCASIEKPIAVDHLIYIPTGPETITGSTRMKAGTATKLVLNMISTTLMIQSGRVYDNLMIDLKATNEKLVDRAIRIIVSLTGLSREDAYALLKNAHMNVKPAIVMHKMSCNLQEANALIEKNDGKLNFLSK